MENAEKFSKLLSFYETFYEDEKYRTEMINSLFHNNPNITDIAKDSLKAFISGLGRIFDKSVAERINENSATEFLLHKNEYLKFPKNKDIFRGVCVEAFEMYKSLDELLGKSFSRDIIKSPLEFVLNNMFRIEIDESELEYDIHFPEKPLSVCEGCLANLKKVFDNVKNIYRNFAPLLLGLFLAPIMTVTADQDIYRQSGLSFEYIDDLSSYSDEDFSPDSRFICFMKGKVVGEISPELHIIISKSFSYDIGFLDRFDNEMAGGYNLHNLHGIGNNYSIPFDKNTPPVVYKHEMGGAVKQIYKNSVLCGICPFAVFVPNPIVKEAGQTEPITLSGRVIYELLTGNFGKYYNPETIRKDEEYLLLCIRACKEKEYFGHVVSELDSHLSQTINKAAIEFVNKNTGFFEE